MMRKGRRVAQIVPLLAQENLHCSLDLSESLERDSGTTAGGRESAVEETGLVGQVCSSNDSLCLLRHRAVGGKSQSPADFVEQHLEYRRPCT